MLVVIWHMVGFGPLLVSLSIGIRNKIAHGAAWSGIGRLHCIKASGGKWTAWLPPLQSCLKALLDFSQFGGDLESLCSRKYRLLVSSLRRKAGGPDI